MRAPSRTSPVSMRTRSPWRRLSQAAFIRTPSRLKLSATITRSPSRSSASARLEPTNPAPPVTRMESRFPFISVPLPSQRKTASGELGGVGFHGALRPLLLLQPRHQLLHPRLEGHPRLV